MSVYKEHLDKRKEKAKSKCGYRPIHITCIECGKDIFEKPHDTRWGGLDTHFYCENCKEKIEVSVPRKYPTCVILEDSINQVKARYQYGSADANIENWLICHWSSKGRFITIKNKRVYI